MINIWNATGVLKNTINLLYIPTKRKSIATLPVSISHFCLFMFLSWPYVCKRENVCLCVCLPVLLINNILILYSIKHYAYPNDLQVIICRLRLEADLAENSYANLCEIESVKLKFRVRKDSGVIRFCVK